MEAWNEITSDIIKKSFRMCALNLSTDWSEDVMINCFKNEKLCKSGEEVLTSQLSILNKKDENPFIDKYNEDIDMVAPVFLSIDSYPEDDEYKEIC